jgi:hypothetical protein
MERDVMTIINSVGKILEEKPRNINQGCFLTRNTKGGHFGHCSMQGMRYLRCDPTDHTCVTALNVTM